METDFNFTLTNTEQGRRREFSLRDAYSCISIKKIVVSSLLGLSPNDWFARMNTLRITITCTKMSGEVYNYTRNFSTLVTPYHAQPVLEFPLGDFIIPPELELENFSDEPFNNVTIDLFYDGEGEMNVSFVYEKQERVSFSKIFQINKDGSLTPNKTVYINGEMLRSGAIYASDKYYGGINLNDYKQYDIAVIDGDNVFVITGFYND